MAKARPTQEVKIVMGSQSDWQVMKEAASILQKLKISHSVHIVSAHRTPDRLYTFAKEANGVKIIIAGAGGAAHLPGMLAALSPLPVFGVPIESKSLSGLDSLLSIAQMPKGVPVGTLAINGAANAALLAAKVLATSDKALAQRLELWLKKQTDSVPLSPK